MKREVKIVSVRIENLAEHPGNPNVMSKVNFKKLVNHIDGSGNYEPIVVRQNHSEVGKFQIINGHHRVKALIALGYEWVNCVVWEVNDSEALVLLNSLNRLAGKDNAWKKIDIIKKLSIKFDSKALSKMLPETKGTIEKLAGSKIEPMKGIAKAFLNSEVFFLDDSQAEIVRGAIDSVIEKSSEPLAIRRSRALVKICRGTNNLATDEQ